MDDRSNMISPYAPQSAFADFLSRLGVSLSKVPYAKEVKVANDNMGWTWFYVRSYWTMTVNGKRTFYFAVRYVSEGGRFHMTTIHQLGKVPRGKLPPNFIHPHEGQN